MGSLPQAVIGAKRELAEINGFLPKLWRLLRITAIFASEIVSMAALAPYAARAMSTYRSLEECGAKDPKAAPERVTICKDVRYGDGERNVLDVYLPPAGAAELSTAPGGRPVVLFCHGGVWAAGEKWHYAPMACRLSEAGVVCGVLHYTLYPDEDVAGMTAEVDAALSWTCDQIARFGGDPARVTVVGHSAGAQLVTMALLQRALRIHRTGGDVGVGGDARCPREAELWMPSMAVGMAGVYDLAKHYEYEAERGVELLSTMERAAGGREGLPKQSPTAILRAAMRRASAGGSVSAASFEGQASALVPGMAFRSPRGGLLQERQGSEAPSSEAALSRAPAAVLEKPLPTVVAELGSEAPHSGRPARARASIAAGRAADGGFPRSFALAGESIAHRIGLHRGAPQVPHGGAAAALPAASSGSPPAGSPEEQDNAGALLSDDLLAEFELGAATRMPPMVLMSSCTDLTVPWYESSDFYWCLVDAGVPARTLVYNKLDHADFVLKWKSQGPAASAVRLSQAMSLPEDGRACSDSGRDLPGPCHDLMALATGRLSPFRRS